MLFQLWLRHILIREANHQPEAGQGLVEYALIMVFVAVLVMVLLIILGPAVANMFDTILNSVTQAQAN